MLKSLPSGPVRLTVSSQCGPPATGTAQRAAEQAGSTYGQAFALLGQLRDAQAELVLKVPAAWDALTGEGFRNRLAELLAAM